MELAVTVLIILASVMVLVLSFVDVRALRTRLCASRHKTVWVHLDTRVNAKQRRVNARFYCPRCKADRVTSLKISQERADAYLDHLKRNAEKAQIEQGAR